MGCGRSEPSQGRVIGGTKLRAPALPSMAAVAARDASFPGPEAAVRPFLGPKDKAKPFLCAGQSVAVFHDVTAVSSLATPLAPVIDNRKAKPMICPFAPRANGAGRNPGSTASVRTAGTEACSWVVVANVRAVNPRLLTSTGPEGCSYSYALATWAYSVRGPKTEDRFRQSARSW